MSIGAFSVFSVNMTSGATLSSFIDLGGSWESAYLAVPSMVSGTDIYLRAGVSSSDTTGHRVMSPVPNTSSIQVNTFTIASSVSGNKAVPIPAMLRYVAIEYTTATTATSHTFKIMCAN